MYTSCAFLSHVDFATSSIGLLLLKDGCAVSRPRDLLVAGEITSLKRCKAHLDVISHSKSDPKPQSWIWAICTRIVGSPKLTLNLTHPHSKSSSNRQTKRRPNQMIYPNSANTYGPSQTPVNALSVRLKQHAATTVSCQKDSSRSPRMTPTQTAYAWSGSMVRSYVQT